MCLLINFGYYKTYDWGTLPTKNGRYAFLIRLGLIFSKSLWKQLQMLPIVTNFKHLSSI